MVMDPSVFKAYDIRGVYPDKLDEELAYKISRAFITLLQKENPGRKLKIIIGRDMRLSSPQLTKSLIRGIVEQGADVVDIGLASTPTFYFAVAYYGLDGGMQVSASHNPKEYNGIKMVRRHAVPVSGDTGIMDVKDLVIRGDFLPANTKGKVAVKKGVLGEEVRHAFKYADAKKIKPMKIVIDTANAMGGPMFKELFRHLPCKIVRMNFRLDGTFPAHQADPFKDENIADLKKKVVEVGADMGIALDGDADRIFFIDDKGERVDPAIMRGILAKIFLRDKPGAKIGYDLRPGRITQDMILESGGIPVVTRVGHSLIKEDCLRQDIYFAGESSGHMFLHMDIGIFEVPLIITLKLLQELSVEKKSLSELVMPYKGRYFPSGEYSIEIKDKQAKIKELEKAYSKGAKDVSHLDGLSVEFDDWWFNVRPSNTEPLLRLNLEAKTKKRMEEMRDKVLAIIRG